MHFVAIVSFNLPHRTGVGVSHTKAFLAESRPIAQFFVEQFARLLREKEGSVTHFSVVGAVHELIPIDSTTDVPALVQRIVDELVEERRKEVARSRQEYLRD